jgi:hypothetical protein
VRLTLSKGIEWFNPASPRQWFQPDHNYRDIVAGVVIDGDAVSPRPLQMSQSVFSRSSFQSPVKLSRYGA